ncbi:hypothetical protein LINPERHAP2_LOCUS25690, partial [Linum perenne]
VKCHMCPSIPEFRADVIRNCSFVVQVWKKVLPTAITHLELNEDFGDWLEDRSVGLRSVGCSPTGTTDRVAAEERGLVHS